MARRAAPPPPRPRGPSTYSTTPPKPTTRSRTCWTCNARAKNYRLCRKRTGHRQSVDPDSGEDVRRSPRPATRYYGQSCRPDRPLAGIAPGTGTDSPVAPAGDGAFCRLAPTPALGETCGFPPDPLPLIRSRPLALYRQSRATPWLIPRSHRCTGPQPSCSPALGEKKPLRGSFSPGPPFLRPVAAPCTPTLRAFPSAICGLPLMPVITPRFRGSRAGPLPASSAGSACLPAPPG